MSESVVTSATKAAGYNIIFQVASRVITFALNAFVLRYVSKDALGIINVRLLLLYSTIQFISRESFRRTSMSEAKSRPWSSVVNLIWLSLPLSIVCGFIFHLIWLKALHLPDPDEFPGYTFAVYAIYAAVVVEMFAEPLFVYGQLNGFVKLRVFAEGSGLLLRCLVMAFFIRNYSKNTLFIFGGAQFLSAVAYVVIYWFYFGHQIRCNRDFSLKSLKSFLPNFQGNVIFEKSLLVLSWSFLKQTFVKQILTEGEKFVMTFFNPLTFSEQGVYDLVNNLGSIGARFVFQPIEESTYLIFSQFIARDKKPMDQDKGNLKKCQEIIEVTLKAMLIIGLTLLVFGFNFSELALQIYAGRTFSEGIGTVLLRWQCLYMLVIAVNGVTETFTFAAMSESQLNNFNKLLVSMSVLFLISSYILTLYLGSPGFIVANCINMSGRILYSVYFIRSYFTDASLVNPLASAIPSKFVILSFVSSFIVLLASDRALCCHSLSLSGLHIAIGAILLTVVAFSIYMKEDNLRSFVTKRRIQGNTSKTRQD